ncbi:MAG: hypothetical protein ACREDW_07390 [Aestuariivirgaceae bacterium]
MNETWPWLALVGLGLFHGINPAMGWLFAIALGLHRQSEHVVWLALIPIALGHAAAIALTVALFAALNTIVDLRSLAIASGIVLIGWALWHALRGHRQRVRIGMRTGLLGLALWSFLMASAHGAGLMIIPVLLPLQAAHGHSHGPTMSSPAATAAAVAVHSAAMLLATGSVAVLVYRWIGLAVLRRAWINFDILWTAMLILAGIGLIWTNLG